MNYHVLLTGATGLLGRYLVRDLLLADVPVAVVVRPSRRTSAQARIDGVMASWEEMLGRELPRPRVLEGDLTQENLGLNDADIDWVDQNCDSVLHNAASLTFVCTDPEGEPWRSNLHGTRNVLGLCKRTGIHDFHHMSTSYVAGLRNGTILESELSEGQEWGNDYERSKVQAEQLVRSADFLSPPTVYRPAIIVGDSQNGFTTTFHGFYASLNLAYTLVKSIDASAQAEALPPTRLTLDGTERKNLIPVDWVSAVTTHIFTHRQYHGQTYHLTPTEAVTTADIRAVLEEAYGYANTEFIGHGTELKNPTELEQLFYEHLKVYNSYWRDDPEFDKANTLAAAPHLPCPAVNKDLLLMLARRAMEMEFRWRDAPVKQPGVEVTH